MTRTPETRSHDPSRLEPLSRLRCTGPERRLPGRNLTKADILLYRRDGTDLAVKDYAARPWWVRHTIGRLLLHRETAAYRAAGGLEGVPRFFGRLDRFALVIEWIDARPLAEMTPERVDAVVFDRLDVVVARLHERGVALADLHHRDVLLARDGSVTVVDLATAYVLGSRPSPWRRRMFERFRDSDRVALARLRARFTGGDVEAAIDATGERAAARYRRARRLKRLWNRLRGKRGPA